MKKKPEVEETETPISRVLDLFTDGERGPELIAAELQVIGDIMKSMMLTRLSEDAIVLLVWDSLPSTKRPTRNTVRQILRAAAELADTYLKPQE